MGERKGVEIATHTLEYRKQSVRAISPAKVNHHKNAEIAKQQLILHPLHPLDESSHRPAISHPTHKGTAPKSEPKRSRTIFSAQHQHITVQGRFISDSIEGAYSMT